MTVSKKGVHMADLNAPLVRHFSLPAYDLGNPILEEPSGIMSSKLLFDKEDILFSKLNPHIPRIWWPRPDDDFINVASTEFVPLSVAAGVDPNFVFQILRSLLHSGVANQFVKGTTGSHQRIDIDAFLNFEIDIPEQLEQSRIGIFLSCIDELISVNQELVRSIRELSKVLVLDELSRSASRISIGEAAKFENSKRRPLSAKQRHEMPGHFPYYGATGQMDEVGDFIFDGTRVLVGEDGSVAREDGLPFVQLVSGKYWVNNHAHVLTGATMPTGALRSILEITNVANVVTGAVQPKLSMGALKSVQILRPTESLSARLDKLTEVELELRHEIEVLLSARETLSQLLFDARIIISAAS